MHKTRSSRMVDKLPPEKKTIAKAFPSWISTIAIAIIFVVSLAPCIGSPTPKRNTGARENSFNYSPAICQGQPSSLGNPKISEWCTQKFDEYKNCSSLAKQFKSKLTAGTTNANNVNMKISEELSKGVLDIERNYQVARGIPLESVDRKAVFLLGNRGSGKTTLSKMLSSDLSQVYTTYFDNTTTFFSNQETRTISPYTRLNTSLPVLYFEPETLIEFWDCPTFEESTQKEREIAANYFLRRTLEGVSSFKFLFTVSYSPSAEGVDAFDFDALATKAVGLAQNGVQNLFGDSVCLVVTKVVSKSNDTTIKSNIAQTLLTYRRNLSKVLKTANTTKSRNLARKKLDFVKLILPKNKNFRKISYVPRPSRCDALSKIPEIVLAKRNILKALQTKIPYHLNTATVRYWQYKPETPEHTNKLKTKIFPGIVKRNSELITKSVSEFKMGFFKDFAEISKEGHHVPDIIRLVDNFQITINESISGLHKNQNTISQTLHEMYFNLTKEVKFGRNIPNIKGTHCQLLQIEEVDRQRRHLDPANIKAKPGSVPTNWLKPLNIFLNDVNVLHQFYTFTETVLNKADEYTVQKNSHELAQDLRKTGVDNVLDFVKNLKVNLPKEIAGLKSQGKIPKSSLEDFLANLRVRLEEKTTISCMPVAGESQKYSLVVSARNLKLSHAILDTSPNWKPPCSEANTRDMHILAGNNLFLDKDIIFTESEMNVYVIAPKWHIVTNDVTKPRKIVLSGKAGENKTGRARDGYPGRPGNHGEAGKNGKNAGSFFGIFEICESGCKGLEVSTLGGMGGSGQDGGNGGDGTYGNPAQISDIPTEEPKVSFGLGPVNNEPVRKTAYGSNGQQGGNGGNGGNSGVGGSAGSIIIINLNKINTHQIKSSVKPGLQGIPGKGGSGGQGGWAGASVNCNANKYKVFKDTCYSSAGNRASNGNAGRHGTGSLQTHGLSNERMKYAWHAIKFHRETNPKPQFQKLVEENAEVMNFIVPEAFASELETEELRYHNLQKAYMKKPGSNDPQLLYTLYLENFLKRLRSYANKYKTSSDISTNTGSTTRKFSESDKIALSYVYSAAVSRIIGLRKLRNTLNVVNTESYFDALVLQINNLKQSDKSIAIENEKQRFSNVLNEKIREAKNLVENTVTPAINKCEQVLEEKQEDLVAEMKQILNKTETNLEEAEQAKRKYEEMLPLKMLFGGLKLIGTLASCFGPIGTAVGGTINAVSSVAEPLVVSDTPEHHKKIEIPQDFAEIIIQQNEKYYEKKIEVISSKINFTIETIQTVTGKDREDILAEIEENTKEAKEKLGKFTELKEKGKDAVKIMEAEKNMDGAVSKMEASVSETAKKQQLSGKSESLKTTTEKSSGSSTSSSTNKNQAQISNLQEKGNKAAERKDKINAVLKKVDNGLKLLSVGVEFINTIQNHKAQLDEMAKTVEDAKSTVEHYQRKLDVMYDKFLPKLGTMTKDIRAVGVDNLAGKSTAALSVRQWQAKEMLEDMRNSIKQFAKGMKVNEEFQASLDKLDKAMIVLTELYETIERYEEKKQLADYIANVNSAGGAGDTLRNKITDSSLRSSVLRLDANIRGNLFLEDYHKAVHAFNQWIFPYAFNYKLPQISNELAVFNDGETKESINELASKYIAGIDNIRGQLKTYKASTVAGDKNLIVSSFIGGKVSSRPFFVWAGSKWAKSIEKLLEGQTVDFRSDVDSPGVPESNRRKAAIKYKYVELKIGAVDPREQNELDEMLKHFRVVLTHSGISVYKVNGQDFVMFDKEQSYSSSFERHGLHNQSLSRDKNQDKVSGSQADYLMSPYTWWTFKLIDLTDEVASVSNRDLKRRFVGKVYLQLEGEGIYFDEQRATKSEIEDLQLTSYYDVYNYNEFLPIDGGKGLGLEPIESCQ